MVKVAFVCHGNICRSPMAEFVFNKRVGDLGLSDEYQAVSFGTSFEEYENPVYPPVRKILNGMGIDCSKKRAQVVDKTDYDKYDYFVVMDNRNLTNLMRIFGQDKERKVYKLLDFASGGEVCDPYYYGGFDKTKQDIENGVSGLIKFLLKNKKIY